MIYFGIYIFIYATACFLIFSSRQSARWVCGLFSDISNNLNIEMDRIDKMDGYQFERAVAYLLSRNGYSNVNVTQSSGDFGVDIICDCCSKKFVFQCKHYEKSVGVRCVQEVYTGAKYYNADVGVVITNSSYTDAAKQLAKKTGVILYDRDDLKRLVSCSIPRKKRRSISEILMILIVVIATLLFVFSCFVVLSRFYKLYCAFIDFWAD